MSPCKKKIEGCTLPKRPLILRTQIITLILLYSPLFSTKVKNEGRTTHFFHRNGEMSRFCLQNSRISAIESKRDVHPRSMIPRALLPGLTFTSCRLIGQLNMAPTRVGYIRSQADRVSGITASDPSGGGWGLVFDIRV